MTEPYPGDQKIFYVLDLRNKAVVAESVADPTVVTYGFLNRYRAIEPGSISGHDEHPIEFGPGESDEVVEQVKAWMTLHAPGEPLWRLLDYLMQRDPFWTGETA